MLTNARPILLAILSLFWLSLPVLSKEAAPENDGKTTVSGVLHFQVGRGYSIVVKNEQSGSESQIELWISEDKVLIQHLNRLVNQPITVRGTLEKTPDTGNGNVPKGGLYMRRFSIEAAEASLTSFEENGLYGFKDSTGKTVIAPTYSRVGEFTSCGIATVWEKKKTSFIDIQGVPLKDRSPYIFENNADPFVEGVSRFMDRGKIGYLDECGKIRIPAQFDGALPFSYRRAEVCMGCRMYMGGEQGVYKGGRWGTIDSLGQWIVPLH